MSKTQESLVARRYANAVLDLAEQSKKTDTLLSDVESLQGMIASSDALDMVLKDPSISKDDRVAAITALAKKAKLNALTVNLLGTLGENGRLSILSYVLKTLKSEISVRRGEVRAEVISARPLSKAHIKKVSETLKKSAGTDVDVTLTVDESIIGGLIIKVGSLQIDHSVKTRLDRLDRALKSSDATSEALDLQNAA